MKSIMKKAISPGAVHSVPADLRKALISDPAALAKWEDITPLARNESICWAISVEKPETRRQQWLIILWAYWVDRHRGAPGCRLGRPTNL